MKHLDVLRVGSVVLFRYMDWPLVQQKMYVKHWTKDTSESVVEHGTSLYDKRRKYEFLSIEDLPSVVEIFDEPIYVEFKFNLHGILTLFGLAGGQNALRVFDKYLKNGFANLYEPCDF